MRLRVDLVGGYGCFDAADEEKAWEMYRSETSIRIRLVEDIFDEGGVVLAGAPLGVNFDPRQKRETA